MHIRIVTSCTGEKKYSPTNKLSFTDFQSIHDPNTFPKLEQNLAQYRTPAVDLYTGRQHLHLIEGIRYFRQFRSDNILELWILSAGYGLIPGDRKIVPYECTFQGMKVAEINAWADHLNIPTQAKNLLAKPADLNLILLGESYLRALKLDDTNQIAAPTIFFTGRVPAKFVKGQGQIRIIPLSNQEAKQYKCGLIGLKGFLATKVLEEVSEDGHTPEEIFQSFALKS